MIRRYVFGLVLGLCLFPAIVARADTLLVPADYPTIQSAIDAAASGDEVVVEPGTYSESVVVPAINLTIRSQSGNPNDTILDGTGNAAEPAMVLFAGNTFTTRIIRGFTLTNSEAHAVDLENVFGPRGHHVVENCRFVDNGPATALDGSAGTLDVLDCEFIGNEGQVTGGAVRTQGPVCVEGCLFENNGAVPVNFGDVTYGGAIYASPAPGDIRLNSFVNNSANYGGAVFVGGDDAVVENNIFKENYAGICAGAVIVFASENAVVEYNVCFDNQSVAGASIGIDYSIGTTVQGNTVVASTGGGAGILLLDANDVLVRANIVVGGDSWGIRWQDEGSGVSGTQECNDSHGNAAADYEGMPPDTTNLSLDPLFCGASGQNFYLREDSPCRPPNNDCNVQIGALPQNCGTNAVRALTWGRVKSIYRD